MESSIWQTATLGLLHAAGFLKERCDADIPGYDSASEVVTQCFMTASKIVSGGKNINHGLEALASPFDHLGARKLTSSLASPWRAMHDEWEGSCPSGDFGDVLDKNAMKKEADLLGQSIRKALESKDYTALEQACERVLSFLPLLPGDKQDGDISLFVYARLASALSSCFVLIKETKPELDDTSLVKDNHLLLFSCDFSGIQSFIYLISTKSALRMLRSRSFYLELMMEHLIDELLDACGLYRCNCLYAGGGHAYVLLPNTEKTLEAVNTFKTTVRKWLYERFGVSLYLACDIQPCSANALFGLEGLDAYSNIFRSLSAKISHVKLTRYDVDAIRAMNSPAKDYDECKICGRPAVHGDLCEWCDRFAKLGGLLTKKGQVFVITNREINCLLSMPVPGVHEERYVCIVSDESAKKMAGADYVIRSYSKNETLSSIHNCRRIWMGAHCPESILEKLTEGSAGIDRLGILRADVDNLGKAFISGFADDSGTKNYVTLSRTMAFSRSMSLFFKCYINEILSAYNNVIVVYSGGDDMFLAGAWDQILDASMALHKAFMRYTGRSLSFSAGYGMYGNTYPIARAALETEELESFAKEAEGKNSVSLFMADEGLRFSWDVFENNIISEKFDLLSKFFHSDTEQGNSFLYRLLDFLREANAKDKDGQERRLNLARCGYLLARMKPQKASDEAKNAYAQFSNRFYEWALNPEERRQLIAAIYLYVYINRTAELN